jgi:hypothetical protein
MAKVGAGEASALSSDGVSMPMALSAIAIFFVSDVSAHGGGPNVEVCHHDRKRDGYHCHRGGGASLSSDAASTNSSAPSEMTRARVPRNFGVLRIFPKYVSCCCAGET